MPHRDARVTGGHALPARWVVHTVGPVWRGGELGEPALLAACYRRSLEEALRIGAATVAFPAISTGVYGYPADLAAGIAVEAVAAHRGEVDVTFCCYSEASAGHHRQALAALARPPRFSDER